MLGYKKIMLSSYLMRRFMTSPRTFDSHYDALGLTPSANQSDIKSAYYKLSMMYHPDKSNDMESAKKFRDITEAYEVLGNVNLKKMYDKGLLVGRNRKHDVEYKPQPEPTDPTIKFYKSRVNRTVAPTMDGRTPIYDFDTWSKEHYGETLKKTRIEKDAVRRRRENRNDMINAERQETYIYVFFAMVCLLAFMVLNGRPNYDLNKLNNNNNENVNNSNIK